jgi:hypothetical protein
MVLQIGGPPSSSPSSLSWPVLPRAITLKFVLCLFCPWWISKKEIFATQNKPSRAPQKFHLLYKDLCTGHALNSQDDWRDAHTWHVNHFLNFHGVGWDWVHLIRRPIIGLMYQLPMIDDYGAFGGMRIGRGNRSTRRIPAPVQLCQPQIPHDLTWDRTRVAAVGIWLLTAWAMARPYILTILLRESTDMSTGE